MKKLITYILITAIIAIPYILFSDIIQYRVNSGYFAWAIITPLLGLFSLITLFGKRQIRFSLPDILFFGFTIYYLIRGIFTEGAENNVGVVLMCLILYAFIRTLNIKDNNSFLKYLSVLLMLSALYQSYISLRQLYGIIPSNNYNFNITGSVVNPAPLGAYLALVLPSALNISLRNTTKLNFVFPKSIKGIVQRLKEFRNIKLDKQKFNRWNDKYASSIINYCIYRLSQLTIVAVLIVLPVTLCRSAWIGAILGILFVLGAKFRDRIKVFLKSIIFNKRTLITVIIACVVIIPLGIQGAYTLKKDSADSRFVIWKICSQVTEDNLLEGVGPGKFKAEYPMYQADYFRDKKNSEKEASLIGNIIHSYNEGFQLLIETGIIGFVLFLLWILSLVFIVIRLIKTQSSSTFYGIAGAFISLLLFAQFWYAFSVPVLLILFIVFSALLPVESKYSLNINLSCVSENNNKGKTIIRVFQFGIVLVTILTSYLGLEKIDKKYSAYKDWEEAKSLYGMRIYESANMGFEKALSELGGNGDFMIAYGKSLQMNGDNKRAIDILLKASKNANNPVLYTTLGECYKSEKNYLLAEEAYQQAYDIIPHRFFPLYLLTKLYKETGKKAKAIEMGNKILTKKVKIESRAITEIKNEVKEILKEYK